MSSVMSEGTVHYGSYSDPSPGMLRRHNIADEPVVVHLQDEQFPSGNELSEDEDSDSEHEDAAESQAANAAVSQIRGSNDSCSHASDSVQYSRELLVFYLYGRIKPRHDQFRSETVRKNLSLVKQLYDNIPSILHFSYSTVAVDKIGVSASQRLPKDTMLGPYSGKYITEDSINIDIHNQWLWEVYGQTGVLSYIDGSDPKYGNWMSFIQCARTKEEQNLKLAQQNTQEERKLYFVATRDIEQGQELLVWYDWEQYSLYFGLPTGLKRTHQSRSDDESTCSPTEGKYLDPSFPADDREENVDIIEIDQQTTKEPSNGSSCSLTKTSTESTCTDDSGIFTCEQESEMHTSKQSLRSHTPPDKDHGESTFETDYANIQPPLLRPLIKNVAEDVLMVQEPIAIPIKPTPHKLTTYAFVQPPTQLTPQFSYIGARDASYSPQASPRRVTQQHPWMGGIRARSRSRSPLPPLQQTTELINPTAAEGGDLWRPTHNGNGPKNQLLYGMFSRSEDGSRWKCARCERQFNSQGSLRAHARIHTGERPYKCKFCLRTFCQASTLRSHERLHTGEKPYKCGVCGRAFTQSAGLRSHLKTHMGAGRFEQ